MANDKFLPYAQQDISNEDIESVQQALSQPLITRGPLVEEFEKGVAAYCGAKYAVAFDTGTAALMGAYYAADVGIHDRVITTPNSFVATIGPAIQKGATPVFVDLDRNTGNMSLAQTILNLNRMHSKGKTIVTPVHFAGIPVDIEAIDAGISDFRTVIIEDAAHAIGSCYKDGSKVGSCKWGHMTMFSFHPAKTITTGEGGMVTTNDEKLYRRLQQYRANGMERNPEYLNENPYPGYYEVDFLSGNYNFTSMQAALGLSQLKRIDSFVEKRKALMDLYRQKLDSVENIRLLSPPENLEIAYHLCVVQIDFDAYGKTRGEVMEALREMGVGTQVHYIPLYRHPFFTRSSGDISEYFPETESYYSQALSLPLYYNLTEDDVERVVKSLKKALSKK